MPGEIGAITKLFHTRDELSFRNIRIGLWPVLLVLPLSIIVGNLRYFDHSITLVGLQRNELIFFLLGLGWLILVFIPKHLIVPFLRLSAIISAVMMLLLFIIPWGLWWNTLYIACKVFNGLSIACAFYLFCFVLNNIERLFGMALIQIYYGIFYTTWALFPVIHAVGSTWSSIVIMITFLVVVFSCPGDKGSGLKIDTDSDGKGTGVPLVIALCVVHYIIMHLVDYIEWAENGVSILAFGFGSFVSVGLVIIIQLLIGRSALYSWLLFLALSLLGLGILQYEMPFTFIFGSFAYGLGDSLGYIIIIYMCAGAIKLSKSLRMYKLFCLVSFIEYSIISNLFLFYFNSFDTPNKNLAFVVVLVLSSICLIFLPFIQKRLFEADWTDGLFLREIEEYSESYAETEKLNAFEQLNLTNREEEILTLLLSGSSPKEIAYTLKISFDTVRFHQKNLYRKLDIQSIAELFARFSSFLIKKKDLGGFYE